MKIFNFPGASLLELTAVADGLRVRCPGCEVVVVMRGDQADVFTHADGCPVYTRIKKGLRRYARKVNQG